MGYEDDKYFTAYPVDPKYLCLHKIFPLWGAMENSHREILDISLKNGASPYIVNDVGDTLLHMACIKCHEEMVARLLEDKYFINGPNGALKKRNGEGSYL